jgi:putative transcription factor
MTECEICGAEIAGKLFYIAIGSSKLRVCRSCSRHGAVVVDDPSAMARRSPGSLVSEQSQLAKARQRLYDQMDHELEEGLGIAEDYGRKIKEARERAGLKQEDLAKQINEKQSILRKIENEEIIPTDEVRAKLERVLKISL